MLRFVRQSLLAGGIVDNMSQMLPLGSPLARDSHPAELLEVLEVLGDGLALQTQLVRDALNAADRPSLIALAKIEVAVETEADIVGRPQDEFLWHHRERLPSITGVAAIRHRRLGGEHDEHGQSGAPAG